MKNQFNKILDDNIEVHRSLLSLNNEINKIILKLKKT